jgi:hypothetical protein
MYLRAYLALGAVYFQVGCGASDTGFLVSPTGGTGGTASGASAGSGAESNGGSGGSGAAGAIGGTGSDTGGMGGMGGEGDEPVEVGPINVVQASETMLSTEGVPTLTFDLAPQAGSAIIVGVSCISNYEGDCTIPEGAVTDSAGNTYSRAVQGEALLSSEQGARAYIFIAENIAASNAEFELSVAPDGASELQMVAWGAIEVVGLAASASFDASGISFAGTDVSTTVTTDLPTSDANSLAIAVLTVRSNDTNILITPEESWTAHHVHQNNYSGPPGHSLVSQVLTETGIVTHTWTHNAPTRGAAGVIATFRGALQD